MYLLQKLNNSFSECIEIKFNHQSCTKLSITIFQQTNYKYKCCVPYAYFMPYAYGMYRMRICIWYDRTCMVWLFVPHEYTYYTITVYMQHIASSVAIHELPMLQLSAVMFYEDLPLISLSFPVEYSHLACFETYFELCRMAIICSYSCACVYM